MDTLNMIAGHPCLHRVDTVVKPEAVLDMLSGLTILLLLLRELDRCWTGGQVE